MVRLVGAGLACQPLQRAVDPKPAMVRSRSAYLAMALFSYGIPMLRNRLLSETIAGGQITPGSSSLVGM